MTSPDSRAEYATRMHNVIEHIDNHLDGPLNLEALAAVAHFSPFHFHRMKVKLIDRPPVTIAYLRHLGPYGEPIMRFWQDIYYPWAATHNLFDQPRYGISHDDPSITAPEQCRYDACAEVAADFAGAGHAFKTTIAGGRYAVLRFKGSVAEVGAAWAKMLREWLPPAACNSMPVPPSSTTPKALAMIHRQACLSARSVFPSRRCEDDGARVDLRGESTQRNCS